jgi:tight adherence protein C
MQFASLRVGVQELCDLAGSLTLVGDHGAKDTLSPRASTLRRRQLADAEGKAGEADQSVLAQLLLALGVLILIGFPAVATSSPSKPREKRHETPA